MLTPQRLAAARWAYRGRDREPYSRAFQETAALLSEPDPADTHSFRFSANTLKAHMAVSGLKPVFTNRYIDTDFLLVIGQKAADGREIPWNGDDPDDVANFLNVGIKKLMNTTEIFSGSIDGPLPPKLRRVGVFLDSLWVGFAISLVRALRRGIMIVKFFGYVRSPPEARLPLSG